ncbi:MAG TPA: hypothetical protein DIV86_04595, partial [Alphaproteobacteria bacterium]|nr:hypothetical protein [Alphaproteobacteria bacterium]
VKGLAKIELQFKSLGDTQTVIGTADFKDAEIKIPEISFNKSPKDFTNLTFLGRYFEGKAIEIREFKIIDKNSSSTGRAIISLNDNIADEIYFSKLSNGNNDVELYYTVQNMPFNNKGFYKRKNIAISGKSFNAEYLIDNLNFSSESISSTSLEIDLKKLYLKNSVHLNNVKSRIKCGPEKCYSADFIATIDNGGELSMKFAPDKTDNIKTFTLKTSNLGRVIEGLGFNKVIQGGDATITAKRTEDTNDIKIITKGNISVQKYKIFNAPVLAKIFSLASITGITEILTGKGIEMKKLHGQFTLYNDYISIEKIISSGNSLGITTQGTIAFEEGNVDLSGVVTPSYSVNAMFGRIPVIGVLFKAKEGEGLIATKYTVKGKYPDKVDVTVNPLSAFTPGVLREIWGRADTKK